MSASRNVARVARPLRRSLNVCKHAPSSSIGLLVNLAPRSAQYSASCRPGAQQIQASVRSQLQKRYQGSSALPAPPFFTEAEPGRTALYDLHVQHGGKMVPFGGYTMPVQYSDLSVGESAEELTRHRKPNLIRLRGTSSRTAFRPGRRVLPNGSCRFI